MPESNPFLEQRLKGIQQALIAHHRGSSGLPSAHAGSERETFLREFLQQVFPAHRRFVSGTITDSEGMRSGQVDIAIEYGISPSFPMPNTTERLLLAESVCLVIEVKSNLSSQWSEVTDTTKKVKALRRAIQLDMATDDVPDRIPVIAVGYTGHRTVKGLVERLESTSIDSRPDAALVIDSGLFYGFNVASTGPLGLYALCAVITRLLNAVAIASPNLMSYVQPTLMKRGNVEGS